VAIHIGKEFLLDSNFELKVTVVVNVERDIYFRLTLVCQTQ